MKYAKFVGVAAIYLGCPACDGDGECVGESGSLMVTEDEETVTCLHCNQTFKTPLGRFKVAAQRERKTS